jgi:uncharacterized protein (DUF2141 family)
MRSFKRALLVSLQLVPLALPLRAMAADLDLTIGPVNAAQGSLRVAVYDSAQTFRKTAVQQQVVPASAGTVSLRFANLKPGDYAIAVFQDLNGNEKLDSNLLGIPSEPYGFSVVTGTLMGPPEWQDVKFSLPDGVSAQAIGLRE